MRGNFPAQFYCFSGSVLIKGGNDAPNNNKCPGKAEILPGQESPTMINSILKATVRELLGAETGIFWISKKSIVTGKND